MLNTPLAAQPVRMQRTCNAACFSACCAAWFVVPLLAFVCMVSFPGPALANTDDSAGLQLKRAEFLSRQYRASDALLMNEMMGRIDRIESTATDIRNLLEALPTPGAHADAPMASMLPARTGVAAAGSPAKAPACPKPPPVAASQSEDDEGATRLPVPLVAGGSAAIALCAGIFIGGRRRRATAAPVPAASAPAEIDGGAPDRSMPLWEPKSRDASPHGNSGSERQAATPERGQATQAPLPGPAAEPENARTVTAAALAADDGEVRVLSTDIDAKGDKVSFDPTLELAEIMLSMGLASGAAQALEEHIRENPRAALVHWLKLLDVYRKDGHRSDFEKAARELRQNFNINATDWLDVGGRQPTLEDFERVIGQIISLWPDPRPCIDYLHQLLEDNRDGMRNGFPQPVAEEIILLESIQKTLNPDLAAPAQSHSAAQPPAKDAAALELA